MPKKVRSPSQTPPSSPPRAIQKSRERGEPLKKKYTAEDVGKKLVSKGLNYEIQNVPLTNPAKATHYINKRGRKTFHHNPPIPQLDQYGEQLIGPKPIKSGPRITDYGPYSEGESNSETASDAAPSVERRIRKTPSKVYRAWNPAHENPLEKGITFDPNSFPGIPLKQELSRSNNPKGKRSQATRSKRVAAAYALMGPDGNLKDNEDYGYVAKIKLHHDDAPWDDNFIDLSNPVIRDSYGWGKSAINAIKHNQQVSLENEIPPHQIMGIYRVTRNPEKGANYREKINTRIGKTPTDIWMDFEDNPNYQPNRRTVNKNPKRPAFNTNPQEISSVITPWLGGSSIETPPDAGFFQNGNGEEFYNQGKFKKSVPLGTQRKAQPNIPTQVPVMAPIGPSPRRPNVRASMAEYLSEGHVPAYAATRIPIPGRDRPEDSPPHERPRQRPNAYQYKAGGRVSSKNKKSAPPLSTMEKLRRELMGE